MNITKS